MRSRYGTVSLILNGNHRKRMCGMNKRGRGRGVRVMGLAVTAVRQVVARAPRCHGVLGGGRLGSGNRVSVS